MSQWTGLPLHFGRYEGWKRKAAAEFSVLALEAMAMGKTETPMGPVPEDFENKGVATAECRHCHRALPKEAYTRKQVSKKSK
jgi:hypothetical protein